MSESAVGLILNLSGLSSSRVSKYIVLFIVGNIARSSAPLVPNGLEPVPRGGYIPSIALSEQK